MNDNRDFWRRVQKRLLPTQKHIEITWVKGHAGEIDIQKGNSTIAHQNDNNNAVASEGSRSIALQEPLLQAHHLRRRIVVSIQAMFLACYTRRQTRREQRALETILERQLEGDAPHGADCIAAEPDLGVEQLFTPTERTMYAQAANAIRLRLPQYPWENCRHC